MKNTIFIFSFVITIFLYSLSQATPIQNEVLQISAGVYHSMVLKKDGSVWAWGKNTDGQLGDGSSTSKSTPVQISGISQMIMIAAGYEHSLALKDDGTVWAWGETTMAS